MHQNYDEITTKLITIGSNWTVLRKLAEEFSLQYFREIRTGATYSEDIPEHVVVKKPTYIIAMTA